MNELGRGSHRKRQIGQGQRAQAAAPVAMPRQDGVRAQVTTALLLGVLLTLGGCAIGERQGTEGPSIVIDRPVQIPPNSAHANFQNGRQVSGTGKLQPYCELEIKTVSSEPQEAQPGRYRVVRERSTLLRDPTTRIPALVTGFSCSDAIFQESMWLLRGESGGNLHSLRCIRPLFHCQMAPALTLAEAEQLTGSAFRILSPEAQQRSPQPGP